MKLDPTSLSNGTEVTIKHASIKWNANFSEKMLEGSVGLTLEIAANCKTVVLDTRKLKISTVVFNSCEIQFRFLDEHPAFGVPVEIRLPDDVVKSDPQIIYLEIKYETGKGDECTALQWLPIEQTKDQKHPFLFSQCQAIHARSLFPCLDYPAQKFTYDAKLTVPKICTGLMSAISTGFEINDTTATFTFEQKIPIPSYLLAICVGVLGSAEISERCRVYSEPSLVEACEYEFADTENFLKTAESFEGKYEWGRYDLIVLPPSFPYGGMENPCLTFVTPTLLAGDRSLANVVAHEIQHSWTGNLVTNESWDHFWLNEGFTRFCESKIVAKTYNPNDKDAESKMFDFQGLQSLDTLEETVKRLGEKHPFTALNIDHSKDGGVDPDDAFSSVPYEKGMSFLVYLEALVGGPEVFEPFLKEYLANFKFKSLSSEVFKAYFQGYFTCLFKDSDECKIEKLKEIDWDTWFNTPGMPVVQNKFDTTLYDKAKNIGLDWGKGKYIAAEELWEYHTEVILIAISKAQDLVASNSGAIDCQKLEETYGFMRKNNAEILFAWFILCIKNDYAEILTAENNKMINFLAEVGRMKFTRPLYRELNEKGGEYQTVALDTFEANKTHYHIICQKMVAKDLGIEL